MDGSFPGAGLLPGAGGIFFSTTLSGGPQGAGTVFKLAPGGTETVLFSFDAFRGPGGFAPGSSLVRDAKGNLYGTAWGGGNGGDGTVFEITPTGQEAVLHSFSGSPDGQDPRGPLTSIAGSLYGTTILGGASNCGTVFKLAR